MKDKSKTMRDGTTAHLTSSGSYYVKALKREGKKVGISYYTLEWEKIELAKARCRSCDEVIESLYCGHFIMCGCGKSFVDTDRWMPERGRYGGEVEIIN